MRMVISFFIAMFFMCSAFALTVDVPLADAGKEAQARELFHEIRCVVCVSEAISDSPAEVARDMRRNIRERVAAGESGEAIKASLVAQYGDVILMKPPLKKETFVLWFAPWIILVVGGFFALSFFRKGAKKS